ncbi:MAG: hypothetical protein RIG27_33530 [Coleofasciculus sp. F4-SAH-05]
MLAEYSRCTGVGTSWYIMEQVGQERHWTSEEQNFARSSADLVSLVLEANLSGLLF